MADAKDIILLYEREGLSQRQIARRLGVSRGTVARVVAEPEKYLRMKRPRVERGCPKMTSEILAFIASVVESDKKAPRKQRHTARVIWQKVRERFGAAAAPAESTVRRYVGELRRRHPEPFIPLAFPPGESMQGDFGEAVAAIAGQVRRICFWAQRLSYSRATFVAPFERPNQPAFLEGQKQALEFFGGVPRRHVIDNMKVAIKEGVGKTAVAREIYDAFQAHYGFRMEVCNPKAPHEKGQVENLVGFVQRNFFTGLPEFASWDELAAHLRQQCELYRQRPHPDQRRLTVGDLLEQERDHLRPLPATAFPCCHSVAVSANRYSLVTFEGNQYSLPTELRQQPLTLRAYARRIEIACHDRVAASHPRSYQRGGLFFDLAHYLTALQRKPRALPYARPFQQASLAPCLRQLYARLCEVDPDRANRRWIEIALFGQSVEPTVFLQAVQTALGQDRLDLETIRYLCLRPAAEGGRPAPLAELPGRQADVRIVHQPASRFQQLLRDGVSA